MSWMYVLLTAFGVLGVAQAGTITVKLHKENVPVFMKGRPFLNKSAYYGQISVGFPPQLFTVVFDTGSGHFFLPAADCHAEACKMHQQYDRSRSETAVDLGDDGRPFSPKQGRRPEVSISYGTGEIVGHFVREITCLSVNGTVSHPREAVFPGNGLPRHCTMMRLICAQQMSKEPFTNFRFDGVIGLGLESLALDPEFHFFGQMTRQHAASLQSSASTSQVTQVTTKIMTEMNCTLADTRSLI